MHSQRTSIRLKMRATGVGWGLGAGRAGAVFGPVLGGFTLGAHWSAPAVFATAGLPLLVAAATTLYVRYSRQDERQAPLAAAETAIH